MADFELHGYLTTGKFQVNDYEIEIERVEGGVRMKVTDGKGKVQQAIINDGSPEISNDDAITMREMFEALMQAYPEWQDAEQARKNAERARDAAEAARKAGFQQMQNQLANLNIDAINDKVAEAVAAANSAKGYVDDVTANQYNGLNDQIFYKSGDVITIGEVLGDSHSLCVVGYCTANRTEVHLKMPVAKRLDRITTATCNSFRVHLANTGGYGNNTGYVSGGTQYASAATMATYVDKVQNCIHIKIINSSGFNLTANECVSARVGSDYGNIPAVMFTLG